MEFKPDIEKVLKESIALPLDTVSLHPSPYTPFQSFVSTLLLSVTMVSFKALLATLAVQALVASATPVSAKSAPVAVSARAEEGQIQYCEHAKWKGVCRIVGVPLNKCRMFISLCIKFLISLSTLNHHRLIIQPADNVRSDWNDRISSIQNMIRSDYTCIWYRSVETKPFFSIWWYTNAEAT